MVQRDNWQNPVMTKEMHLLIRNCADHL